MSTLTVPDGLLEVTLETLQLITCNLTARFSSRATQRHLVGLVGYIAETLLADLAPKADVDSAEKPEPVDAGTDTRWSTGPSLPNPDIPPEPTYSSPGVISDVPVAQTRLRSSDLSVHPIDAKDLISKIIQALFDTISTIAHQDCIEDAVHAVQAAIDNPICPESVHDAARVAIRKVWLPTWSQSSIDQLFQLRDAVPFEFSLGARQIIRTSEWRIAAPLGYHSPNLVASVTASRTITTSDIYSNA
jgi:hypothetical protein